MPPVSGRIFFNAVLGCIAEAGYIAVEAGYIVAADRIAVAVDCIVVEAGYTVEFGRIVADCSLADFGRMIADYNLFAGRRKLANNFAEPIVDSW